jgi:homoserine kinase
MRGKLYRFVVAIVAAIVALANNLFGAHLNQSDVLGFVLTALGLILAEAHVDNAKASSSFLNGFQQALIQLAKVIGEAKSSGGPTSNGSAS